jgi:hypothetical protein
VKVGNFLEISNVKNTKYTFHERVFWLNFLTNEEKCKKIGKFPLRYFEAILRNVEGILGAICEEGFQRSFGGIFRNIRGFRKKILANPNIFSETVVRTSAYKLY